MKRTIIKIDDSRCNGCGLCVKGCHEGALQLIEGKAVLVSELYCDGLGACLGECPQQAIELEEREAEAYDERKVMQRLLPKGEKVISAHLRHLATQGQQDYLQQAIDVLEENHLPIPVPANKSTPQNSFLFHATPTSATGGCPGSRNITFTPQSSHRYPGIGAKPNGYLHLTGIDAQRITTVARSVTFTVSDRSLAEEGESIGCCGLYSLFCRGFSYQLASWETPGYRMSETGSWTRNISRKIDYDDR